MDDYVVETESSNLRVRSGPGTGYRVINALRPGTRVRVTRANGDWKELSAGGWVHGDYLRAASPGGQPPSSLDLAIQRLLRSGPVREINFTWRGVPVSRHGFHALANRFSDTFHPRRLRVTTNPRIVGPRAKARYDPENDKINLRSTSVLHTPEGQSVVIHECSHALSDLRGMRRSVRSEEAMALISETWYLMAAGHDPATIDPRLSPEIEGVVADLRERADRTGARAAVTQSQINVMRRRAGEMGYPMRHDFAYGFDGIGGRVYRGP